MIAVPPPEDAPRIAARLLSNPVPFAVLLPAELAPRIADDGHFPDQPDLAHVYMNGGKIMFLGSDQLWFVGILPSFQQYSKIYAQINPTTFPTPPRTLCRLPRSHSPHHHCRMETSSIR